MRVTTSQRCAGWVRSDGCGPRTQALDLPKKQRCNQAFRHSAIKRLCLLVWSFNLAACVWASPATTREQELASCRPGEITTWPDGLDRPAQVAAVRLVYRHAGAPAWFDEALVLSTVQRAAAAWSACGVPAEVIGEEAATLYPGAVTVVQWNEAETRGNFALANLGQRTLSLSAAMFGLRHRTLPRREWPAALRSIGAGVPVCPCRA